MARKNTMHSRLRGVALLMTGLIIGGMFIGTATAHRQPPGARHGHIFNVVKKKHFTKKQTKNLFFTKAQSNNLLAEKLSTNVVVRRTTSASATNPITTANCNPGEIALGGGGETIFDAYLSESRPQPSTAGATPTGWTAQARHEPAAAHDVTVTAFAICARP